jgi:septal ring factor EnvC (AmiA/AmiB activator)
MMGLSTVLSPSPQEIIAEAKKLATAPAVKKLLGDTSDALAALADRQKEITALQQAVTAERASFDKFVAESNANIARQAAMLDDREKVLQARVAKFEKVVGEFEGKLAAHAATLESST